MTTLNKLEKTLEKAIANYNKVKDDIAVANERVNVAAQLFSMGEVEKDILADAVELRDTVVAQKAAAWDLVAKADMDFNKMKKANERAAKVSALKKKLAELSK